MNQILLLTGSCIPIFWGIAHLFPTRSVVKNFGDITKDNQHIITMEWIIEGVALIYIGIVVACAALMDPQSAVASIIFPVSSLMLFILAGISAFTGFKVNFLPYKLCPVIFTVSAILILLGSYILRTARVVIELK